MDDPKTLQVLTTEHFVLQGVRSASTSESASRSGLYLTVLSATMVALAFVAQIAENGNDIDPPVTRMGRF